MSANDVFLLRDAVAGCFYLGKDFQRGGRRLPCTTFCTERAQRYVCVGRAVRAADALARRTGCYFEPVALERCIDGGSGTVAKGEGTGKPF